MTTKPIQLTRRAFVKGTAACAAMAACGAAGGGCAGTPADPGKPVTFPAVVDGQLIIRLDMPADGTMAPLNRVGGSVIGLAAGMSQPIVLVRSDPGQITATNSRCTHMGCTMAFNELNYTLDCPCHGSSFELDGRIVTGPASEPVKSYPTQYDGRTLIVTVA